MRDVESVPHIAQTIVYNGKRAERGSMNVDRIRETLSEKGMSQNEFARRCEVSAAHMSNVMNGKRQPRLDLLHRMCEVLGARPEEIW